MGDENQPPLYFQMTSYIIRQFSFVTSTCGVITTKRSLYANLSLNPSQTATKFFIEDRIHRRICIFYSSI